MSIETALQVCISILAFQFLLLLIFIIAFLAWRKRINTTLSEHRRGQQQWRQIAKNHEDANRALTGALKRANQVIGIHEGSLGEYQAKLEDLQRELQDAAIYPEFINLLLKEDLILTKNAHSDGWHYAVSARFGDAVLVDGIDVVAVMHEVRSQFTPKQEQNQEDEA